MTFIANLAGSVWSMLTDSAFLLLVGIFLAGIIHLVLNEKTINRFLKGSRRGVILKASLVGVPLPLCSCSVLPVATQLRRSGLTEGGTAAFLVSTPETGVDSILLTYSLTDPLMTAARPVTAFVSAMAAGLLVSSAEPEVESAVSVSGSGVAACGCHEEEPVNPQNGTGNRFFGAIKYAFVNLAGDIAPYLFMGYLLAGLVALLLGQDMLNISESLRTGWGGYVGALIIGLPLYVCATSSTPLAAALLAAGFSHGAVLVFLLVGPATNLASLSVVRKILGGWSTVRYLVAIVVVSVVFGVGLDALYRALDFNPVYLSHHAGHEPGIVSIVSAIFLALHITFFTFKKLIARLF